MLELMLKGAMPDLRVARIVMSEVIEQHIREKTGLGEEFARGRELQKRGELMSDGPIFSGLEQEIRKECLLGNLVIILDGMPRNVDQARPFVGAIWFRLFHIDIGLETSLARADRRRQERAEANLEPREDDEERVVIHRYRNVFERQTLRAIRMLENSRKPSVIRIPGERPVRDQVTKMVKGLHPIVDVRSRARILSQLDNPRHPATMIMVEMERPRAERVPIHTAPTPRIGLTAAYG
jgi:adenylate kinase family enzyme